MYFLGFVFAVRSSFFFLFPLSVCPHPRRCTSGPGRRSPQEALPGCLVWSPTPTEIPVTPAGPGPGQVTLLLKPPWLSKLCSAHSAPGPVLSAGNTKPGTEKKEGQQRWKGHTSKISGPPLKTQGNLSPHIASRKGPAGRQDPWPCM